MNTSKPKEGGEKENGTSEKAAANKESTPTEAESQEEEVPVENSNKDNTNTTAATTTTTARASHKPERQRQLSDDEVSEDNTALLPRHTKVLVSGNNRTKSKLVGLKGVVKKAVGLGGWHWLVLSDGSHVRLQRNALTVLEQPTGEEESDSDDDDQQNANNAKVAYTSSQVARRRESSATSGVSTREQRQKRKPASRDLYSSSGEGDTLHVNFHKLEAAALKRYRSHYKLQVTPNATKDQLVSAVGSHFMSQKVDERKVIHTFFQSMISRRALK